MKLPPPLFLLAPLRSFTSVTNAVLGQHPQMFGLPEINLFNVSVLLELWQAAPDERGAYPMRRHGILRTVAEIYTGEQTDETIEFAEHWCSRRKDLPVGEVFQELREKLYPLIPVDKSPNYTIEPVRMLRILEACPNARFIHLTRHPIKQCESTMNLCNAAFPKFVNSIEYQDNVAILEPQIAWHDLNINILNFLENHVPQAQWMRMQGEELMEHPEEELGKICRWMGIRDDAEAIKAMMHPERSPFACFGPISAAFGNDPNFLRGPKFRKHKPSVPPLHSPLSWREDGLGLYPEVLELAQEFGYR